MSSFLIVPDQDNMLGSDQVACRYDLGYEYNDFAQPAILDDDGEKQRLICRYLTGFCPPCRTLHGAFYDVSVFSPDPLIAAASRLRIRQSLDAARQLGVAGVVFHSNINPFLTAPAYIENWRQRTAEFFLSELAAHPELDIWMENMFDSDPAPLLSLAESLSGCKNFGLCLDYGHAVISATPPRQWAETLAPYIRHIHINDNDGKQDLHLPLGQGRIDWDEFFRLRQEFFPEASVLLEVYGRAAQEQSVDFLRERGIL